MRSKARRHVHHILDGHDSGHGIAHAIQWFIVALIATNVIAVILDSVDWIWHRYSTFLYAFEVFSVVVFSIEYLLRLWSCVEDEQFRHPIFGRAKYALTPLALVDLAAIVPFYFPLMFPIDLRFLRALRLMRIFRVLKLGRHSESLRMFTRVIKAKREEFAVTLFVVSILLTIASSMVYFAEHEAQPKAFGSIPHAMWWAVMTLSTVGYGDMYPITPLGRFLAALIAILGVALFAMPTAILASGFIEEMHNRQGMSITCPHCGRVIRSPKEGSNAGQDAEGPNAS
jgi:voltage-gated potassium channel